MLRYLPAGLLAALVFSTSACARTAPRIDHPAAPGGVDQRAYSVGYDEGAPAWRTGRPPGPKFPITDVTVTIEMPMSGYRGNGDQSSYRSGVQEGFAAGYNDGYRRCSQGGYSQGRDSRGGYPQGRYPQGGYSVPTRKAAIRRVRYPQGGYGSYGSYGSSPAGQNGYRDGYEQGRNDARGRNRFDPVGPRRYRSGDQDYDRRYGSRDDYKREYRAAFQAGYEQGYRGSRP